jgi:hypothetical protein
MKTPLMSGIDGIDAQNKIEPVIGDDDLNDAIYHLSQMQGPDADCRPLVKTWLNQNMPELLSQIEFGDNNGDDDKTNFTPPITPQAPASPEYGAGPSATQNELNMTYEDSDPLRFIRTLAGLAK